MNEEMSEIPFTIIEYSGDAKGIAFGALLEAKKGNTKKAEAMIEKSEEIILKAHKLYNMLIENEVSSQSNDVSMILIHAQEHLMNTMTYHKLVNEFIELYNKL